MLCDYNSNIQEGTKARLEKLMEVLCLLSSKLLKKNHEVFNTENEASYQQFTVLLCYSYILFLF